MPLDLLCFPQCGHVLIGKDCRAIDILCRVSSEANLPLRFVFPFWDSESLLRDSALSLLPNLFPGLPFFANDIFRLCSNPITWPWTPSPPSVRFLKIPVSMSLRPYHLIYLRSKASAPILDNSRSRNTILCLCLGRETV